MSNRMLRFINNTSHQEPLDTNQKGDILRTGDNEYSIRSDKEYHVLTDNVKTIETDEYLKAEKTDNNVDLSIDEQQFIQLIKDNSPVTTVNGETGDVVIDIPEVPEINHKSLSLNSVITNLEDYVLNINSDINRIQKFGNMVNIRLYFSIDKDDFTKDDFTNNSLELFCLPVEYRPINQNISFYRNVITDETLINDVTYNIRITTGGWVILNINGHYSGLNNLDGRKNFSVDMTYITNNGGRP